MSVLLFCITMSAGLLILAAAVLFYLSAEKQRLLPHALPSRTGVGGGVLLLVVACVLLRQYFGLATVFFVTCTVLMLALSVLPVGIALIRRGRA